MSIQRTSCIYLLVAFLFQGVPLHGKAPHDSWKQFRGDGANGVSAQADLPTRWSESSNCVWKTSIPGRGWSSPVVDGEQVWLTTATEDGLQMSVICLDVTDGRILFEKLVFENETVQPDFHPTNSYASPTPVLDEQFVYVHFGAYGTACLDRKNGEKCWERRDLPCNHYRGAGSSPILYENLLIFHMDGYDYQYAVALDKKTGATVWKKNREVDYGTDNGDLFKAFSTPIVIRVDGMDQLISPASMACIALHPRTGKEIWRVRYSEHSTTVRPLFDGSRVYISTGFGKAKMLCVRVNGEGDVTNSHIDWIQPKSIGSKPSPVLVNGLLFDVTDKGIVERLSVESGEIEWKQRLEGQFSASLVANSEHVYAFNHEGDCWVFTAKPQPELVAKNTLPDGCNASPAIFENSLIVRTNTTLYRFANQH